MLRVLVLSMLLALHAGLALADDSVQVAMSSQEGPRNLSVEKTLQFGEVRETQDPTIYIYGQFMKFVRRGALRAESSLPEMRTFSNMVFINPDGRAVLVAVNSSRDTPPFAVRCGEKMFDGELPGGTAVTYSWKKDD